MDGRRAHAHPEASILEDVRESCVVMLLDVAVRHLVEQVRKRVSSPRRAGSTAGNRRAFRPGRAHRELVPSVQHRRSKYLNNRAENSHQPTRQRERAMKHFTSIRHAQRFLSAFSGISAHFRPRRHLLSAGHYRRPTTDG